jgi:hypothetical protein
MIDGREFTVTKSNPRVKDFLRFVLPSCRKTGSPMQQDGRKISACGKVSGPIISGNAFNPAWRNEGETTP